MKWVTAPDGSKALVDDATVSYMQSVAPQPTQDLLVSVLENARRIQVVRGGSANGSFGTEVLAATDDPDTVEEFRQSLQIRDGGCGHCMCHGDPTLVLSGPGGEIVAVLGVHHGRAVRWSEWKDDATLVDGERLLRSLAALGVAYPMERAQDDRRRRLESLARAERWRAAIPPALAAHPVFDDRLAFDPAPLIPVLESALPDPRARALALFDWFGHGAGPWSGFPAYEELPEKLLLAMPIEWLLDALHSENLTDAQLEGAARLFGGWEFGKLRRHDRDRLTTSDKQRLLDRAMRSTDLDKQARAQRAFKAPG